MRRMVILSGICTFLLVVGLAGARPRRSFDSQAITVSGIVSGPDGPVPDVRVSVGSSQDWQETTTNASGHYSVSIMTDGELWMHVRPELDTRLTQDNKWMDGITGNLTQNFEVVEGNLLSLRLTGHGGVTITEGVWFDAQPLEHSLAEGHWYALDWDGGTSRHQALLPPDIYYVTVSNPPEGYFSTSQGYDLRAADAITTLPLNTSYVHPIPYDPPDASKISFGPVDELGEAGVMGAPGATLPLARVLLVNLNSTHQADAISEADGSFSSRIYAPPGSAIMIKHGPPGPRWKDLQVGLSEGVNPFPGTIINIAHSHEGGPHDLPFAASGAIDYLVDDPSATRNHVGSAWAISGTLGSVVVDGEWSRVLNGVYDGVETPGLYLGGLNWTHPAMADVDADDDLDLIVGERSGSLVLYENAGSATAPDWRFQQSDFAGIAGDWWLYPHLVDVTGDGALDLFVGNDNGTVTIYHNDGTASEPLWPDTPDSVLAAGTSNAVPALDDLDGDGDLDLLVGHGGGTVSHFENSGSPQSPDWTLRSAAYGGISEAEEWLSLAFIDLDNDSDRDLLVGLCGQLLWYERVGAVNPTWNRVASNPIGLDSFSCAVSPGVGDWNNDDTLDVVTGEHWGTLRFAQSNSPTTWTEVTIEFPFEFLGDSAPALADWDDDGDVDMLVGQAHGEIYQYTNIGDDTAPDWRPDGLLLALPWTDHPHAFPTLADVDGDKAPELFVGEGGWQGPGAGGTIHYYHNDGAPNDPSWTLVSDNWLGLDVGGWSTPVFADIDDDNDLDLFIGAEDGTLTYVENGGTPLAPAWSTPVNPYADLHLGAHSAPAFLDADEDGDLDMLVGLEHGSLAYVRNVGTADSPAWEVAATQHPDIDIGELATPAAADLDGDGRSDLLIGDGDGGLNLFLYEGPGIPPPAGGAYQQGDLFQVAGTIRLYSPAITATTDVSEIAVHGSPSLLMLANGSGQPLAATNAFMSTMLTPTGFPIQRSRRSAVEVSGQLSVDSLHFAGGNAVEGRFTLTGQVPDDLPLGTYRPFISLGFSGVPTDTRWLAANVTNYYTFGANEAILPPITVGEAGSPRLIWRLMMDDIVQGTRGAGAREDIGLFELSSQIVSQGAPFHVPMSDARSGRPIDYRLEPFLPTISFTDRRMPAPPLIPFELPGGELCVTVQAPDGTTRDLGCDVLDQSFNRTKTTRAGNDLNVGTVQLDDVYSLKADSDQFVVAFDQYGRHTVSMTGYVSDLWGNSYPGGGTYDVWVARPLDFDPGVLPGTPLAVGDAFNPAMQFYPRVPADFTLRLSHYPNSEPDQMEIHTLSGQANVYGYFGAQDMPISLTEPGEYRVDVTAVYTATDGTLYMGAMTWGSVVMTPAGQANLVAHGRRGLDSLEYIPNHWFVAGRDLDIPDGAISHALNPYFNGDMLWSRLSAEAEGGNALVMGASVQDTVGVIEAAVLARAARMNPATASPGDIAERFSNGEIPLFSSTYSGRPAQMVPEDVDQIAYSYRTSQRPGVRVREFVAEDGETGGYWRLDTLYDDQLGVGISGDQVNDFKFQYVGAVFRDLVSGHNEYLGQGSGWVFISDDDPLGNRVMPPFAGPGNGGWTTEGGPILTLQGEEIHIFFMPTGTGPGAILEPGDTFHFAGHLMPTLNSQVTATITAPSGAQHPISGQANKIGYYYDPTEDLIVDEPGLWTVDVDVWHDGQCSGGATVPPYPSGDVLGSDAGRYWFYVVPAGADYLNVGTPSPGFLSIGDEVKPITISGVVPPALVGASVDYTLSMPGYILEHGQVTVNGGAYQIKFDPAALHDDFPNLDLVGRDDWIPGLSDTFALSLLLRGQLGDEPLYQANTITIQGEQVFIGAAPLLSPELYLPVLLKGD